MSLAQVRYDARDVTLTPIACQVGKLIIRRRLRNSRRTRAVLLRIARPGSERYIHFTSWKGKLFLMECIASPDKVSGI
jgi:hypothetical protein